MTEPNRLRDMPDMLGWVSQIYDPEDKEPVEIELEKKEAAN